MTDTATPPHEFFELLRQGRLNTVAKGEVIDTTDSRIPLTLVKEGYIKRYSITPDGSQSIQIIHGPDSFFPLTPICKELLGQALYVGPETFYYETMTNSEIYTLSFERFVAEVQTNAQLYRDLFYICGTRLSWFIHEAENLATHDAYNRLAHKLLFFTQQFGEETSEGISIKLPLTHYDLASILNVTRETVTANIIKLRDKHLIKTEHNILVLDVEGLSAEAYS